MNKNKFARSRNVLELLIQGAHPTTGEDLPKDSIINNIEVTRALIASIDALKQVQARVLRRALLPEKVGRTWSKDEEATLREEFQAEFPIPEIADAHGRTVRAIEARLERMGLMTAAQRTTDNSFTGTPQKVDEV